ncbi:C-factor-like [Sitodiplosis mosellana]|uniref:C-factor-like n=1 Tax=Sitodiplosis mosellana TaxID=263140 RepID=UPI00244403B0|nr:C-factor-like [Sitodiplosis mosellana]
MNSILITGCSRGLGLGLVKQLLELSDPINYIFATCRNPDGAQELNELKAKHGNLHVFALDVTDYASFDALVKQIDEIVKEEGLNVLINNAGIYPSVASLNSVVADDLRNILETNSIAPVMVTKAFIPLLQKASKFNDTKTMGVHRATIVNISSSVGSIENVRSGRSYAYRMSKAALNMATKTMSVDLKKDRILCIVMHPGWVQTDMGGLSAPLKIDDSCKQMVNTILALNESENGTFVQFNGKSLPWNGSNLDDSHEHDAGHDENDMEKMYPTMKMGPMRRPKMTMNQMFWMM